MNNASATGQDQQGDKSSADGRKQPQNPEALRAQEQKVTHDKVGELIPLFSVLTTTLFSPLTESFVRRALWAQNYHVYTSITRLCNLCNVQQTAIPSHSRVYYIEINFRLCCIVYTTSLRFEIFVQKWAPLSRIDRQV